jgi:hypothetical protein
MAAVVTDGAHPLLEPALNPSATPIVPVYFTDIVPDQGTWQQYCTAFAG